MFERQVEYYNRKYQLTWDENGFLLNPGPVPGNAWDAKVFRDVVLTIIGTGNIKVYGSAQAEPPKFEDPSTLENTWTPIALVDYSLVGAPAYFDGATGITVTNETKLAELDTNGLTWFAIKRTVTEGNVVDVLATVFTAV